MELLALLLAIAVLALLLCYSLVQRSQTEATDVPQAQQPVARASPFELAGELDAAAAELQDYVQQDKYLPAEMIARRLKSTVASPGPLSQAAIVALAQLPSMDPRASMALKAASA